MKTITLSQGKEAIVDDVDFEHLSKRPWSFAEGYAVRRQGKKTLRMHREVIGARSGMLVDHRNGNTLDNRRENLRECSYGHSVLNTRAHSRSKTGVKGVVRFRDKYRATIQFRGKWKHIGLFETLEAAKEAYMDASLEMHGAFSYAHRAGA